MELGSEGQGVIKVGVDVLPAVGPMLIVAGTRTINGTICVH